MTAVPDSERIAVPPRKRRRSHVYGVSSEEKRSQTLRLFAPFRALGLVTNHVPFVLQTRSFKGATEGPRTHILTCLGRSWALWEGGKMGLLFVGPEAPHAISSLSMDGDVVWAASGPLVIKYLRGKEIIRLENPLGSHLSSLAIFGSQLMALTQDGKRLLVWDKESGSLDSTVEFEPGFTATSLLHPATYINKVLVGSMEGSLQLWNIRTQACIHKYSSSSLLVSPSAAAADGSSYAITALTQSPAIDVVGIGFATGEISVYDVRADERLMRMFMEGGNIRALGFRSDGHPILATASSIGHIALWDLNAGGQLLHIVRGAHDGPVVAVEWVPGQPVMISSGEDNSVKYWLFDSPTAPPRLLKYRSGHHAPPHLIRYYGEDGKQLLSASRDRSLRCTSIVRDSRSFEMSQGSLAKKASTLSIPLTSLKFPPIVALSYSTTRSKDWDDVLTAHTDESCARTWSTLNKRLGKHTFTFTESAKGKARVGSVKAVCVTACGNFGVAGTSTGAIYTWNMQSGMRRKNYDLGPCPPQVTSRFRASSKKEGRCVTGIATDALNRVVIVSTLDGTINFFDFHTTKLEHSLVLPSSAVTITLQRDTGLLAIVSDDLVVRIVDIETRRIVRELGGFKGRVLDIAFSPDSRWLIVSSLDRVVRTFDLPTGHLIDAFRTSSAATSISFSPTGDFLATAHVDSVGVYLWANRAQYAEVSFQSIDDEDLTEVGLPSMHGMDEEEEAVEGLALSALHDTPKDAFVAAPQLEGDLVTLTLLPRSRWQTLLNLEVIQQRNKPKEPPKQPEKAPFFLPTLPGLEPRFAVEQKAKEEKAKQDTKRLQKAAAESDSTFQKRLEAESVDGDFEAFFNYAKSLSPAALDLELRSLVALDSVQLFLRAMTQRLRSRRDFEAVETMLAVFLRMHGDILIANAEVRDDLQLLLDAQRRESDRIMELIASSLGTLGFIRDTL